MIPNKHFGKSLKLYLEKKGIKAKHIAITMGVSGSSFSNYYNSEYPRPETQQKILNALGITIEELYLDEDIVQEDIEEHKGTESMVSIPMSQLLYLLQRSQDLGEIKDRELAKAEEKVEKQEERIQGLPLHT